MCGFSGYFSGQWLGAEALPTLARMTATLIHRGPDSDGQWLDADSGIALGNRRLAIVDL